MKIHTNNPSICSRVKADLNQAKFSAIAGAAFSLAGGAACVSIGGLRLVPCTTLIAGLGLLYYSIANQNKTPVQSSRRPRQIQANSKNENSSSKMWKSLLAIAAIAIPVFYLTRIAGCAPQDVLPLDSADPNRPMAMNIQNEGEIDSVISTVFSEHTDLAEVQASVKQDWATVKRLGINHIELGQHLQALYNAAPVCKGKNSDIVNQISLFTYDPNQFVNNTIGKISKLQILNGCTEIPKCCFEELEAKNPMSNVQIKIHNSLLDGLGSVFDKIQKYGFYGIAGSPDRIDPIQSVALLTGQSVCSILTAIGKPCS